MIVPFLIPITLPPVRVAPPLFGWCDGEVRSKSPWGKVTRFATSGGERSGEGRGPGRVGSHAERGPVRAHGLVSQPARRALRSGSSLGCLVDVFLQRGQLGLGP